MAASRPSAVMSTTRRTPPRPLRRLRRALVLVGALAAVLMLVATRLEALARTLAAVAAFACLVAWLVLLESEGRAAERLETRARRRIGRRHASRTPARSHPLEDRRRAA